MLDWDAEMWGLSAAEALPSALAKRRPGGRKHEDFLRSIATRKQDGLYVYVKAKACKSKRGQYSGIICEE
jgi:hypothetical protein